MTDAAAPLHASLTDWCSLLEHHPDPAAVVAYDERLLWTNRSFDRWPLVATLDPQRLVDLPLTESGLDQIRSAIQRQESTRFWVQDIEVTVTPGEEEYAPAMLFFKPWTMPDLGAVSGDWTVYLSLMHNPFLGIWRLGFEHPIPVSQSARQIAEVMIDSGFFVECNETMARMYRFPNRETMLGKPVHILYPSREPVIQRVISMVENGFRSEMMDSVEVDQAGKTKAFRTAYYGHVEQGMLQWVSGVQMDITERHHAQVLLEVLHRITHSALTTEETDTLYDVIRRELGRIIDATSFYVVSVEPDTGRLSMAINYDAAGNVNPPTERSLAARVIQTRKAIRLLPQEIRDLHQRGEIEGESPLPNSWLGVPLEVSGRVTGALVVQSYGETLYDDEDLKVLQLVSDQVALAIHRKRALEDSLAYRRRLESLLKNIPEAIYTSLDQLGSTTFISERWEAWTGVPPSAFREDPETWKNCLHPEDRPRAVAEYLAACEAGQDYLLDYRVVHNTTGEVTCIRDQGIRVEDANGVHYDGIISDVTDFKINETRLRASLQEKEMLLKEVHHRVKNNLQIVMSLLSLQAHKSHSETVRAHLIESQNRVRSMAMIHEKLYKSESMTHIDFKGYLQTLATQLFQTYSLNTRTVQLVLDVEDVPLTMDFSVPCGLLVNELMTNALKYAFPPDFKGPRQIRIALARLAQGGIRLDVQDTGVGLPQSWTSLRAESLGLQLVGVLAQDQLGGRISQVNDPGCHFHMEFKPDSHPRKGGKASEPRS